MAISLDGWLWVASFLVGKIPTTWLTDMHFVHITTPLHIVIMKVVVMAIAITYTSPKDNN